MVLSGSSRDGALSGARSSHALHNEARSQGSRRSLLNVLGHSLEFAQQQGDQAAFSNLLQEANDTIQFMSSSLDTLSDEIRETLPADFHASELVQRILELSNRESTL